LLQAGKLQIVTPAAIQVIEDFCWHPGVLEALGEEPKLVHSDLGGENIFVASDGYRVIDWQRPIYGP
jgi:serine/threonine-protein kinase RIO1